MVAGKIDTNESDLNKLSVHVKYIRIFLIAVFTLSIITWIILSAFTLLNLMSVASNENANISQSIIDFAGTLLIGASINYLLGTITFILGDIRRGQTPFNDKQIRRIKTLSLCFVLYGTLDIAASLVGSSTTISSGIGFGNIPASGAVSGEITLNVTAFLAALVVYGLALVFEYGKKLQDQSDSFI